MKYLLPYKAIQYHLVDATEYYSRAGLTNNSRLYSYLVWKTNDRWLHDGCFGKSFATKEDAMKSMDEYLVSQGYILLTEEQAEKLKVLI